MRYNTFWGVFHLGVVGVVVWLSFSGFLVFV